MSYNTTAWTTDGQTQTIGGATLYKEFGLFDFSPSVGIHNAMIGLNALSSTSANHTYGSNDIGGSGTDPATTLDIDDDGESPRSLVASIWYIEDNITIDSARVITTADGNQAINFHVMSYDIDTSGNLSNGTLLAHIGSSISATAATVKTDTLTIDSSSVSSSKIILAFAEAETDTSDISCKMTIKYHLT
tara:strand:- start:354 stop:923 length:570 start_codon:yes stop_codon:yes gene_type:complete